MIVENATSPWGQSWERVFHKHKCIPFIARVLWTFARVLEKISFSRLSPWPAKLDSSSGQSSMYFSLQIPWHYAATAKKMQYIFNIVFCRKKLEKNAYIHNNECVLHCCIIKILKDENWPWFYLVTAYYFWQTFDAIIWQPCIP